ncbi:hypothetical protein AUK40_01825 [Candidatus Wirthbacteria bacterium CG2_30_54_11]|uniref:Glycogen synthase n=1 Tax=Candidatus Wirthbacteria bacterium CG2_30_54_11 TaxID=1817892 RepID=A0A1J5IM43_9BACT|nr:MAG: hypothetical protein AUK40_01825 [Candidatus Wirthbacteria bacterium CG2_30_54_11]
MKAKADICFEVSWEAANKVGGIYTVIKSKARQMKKHYKDYYLIGPYIAGKSELDVEFEDTPRDLVPVFREMEKQKIKCRYGRWMIESEPKVILIDAGGIIEDKDAWKKLWWESYGIDSLRGAWDFEEPMLWASAAGILIEKIAATEPGKNIVAQCHEWMAGFALLWLKLQKAKVGTVFTTHATMLGRSIAGSGRDLYAELDTMDPKKEAYGCNIESKFTTEYACAQTSDAFTTVSATTAMEAEKILGRKPDVLVLNGLDSDEFPVMEDLAVLHRQTRDKMRDFFSYYFFPYEGQYFDLEETLAFFMVGRYEYRNKGMDVYLEALGQLNETMKKEKTAKRVVAFIWVPAGIERTRAEIIESKNYYYHLRTTIRKYSDMIFTNLSNKLLSREKLTPKNILPEEFFSAVKKDVWKFQRKGCPPSSTHVLTNETQDTVMRELKRLGLDNGPEDFVKVIFYPVYLDGNDGFLNLSYYDAMAACHLGVFPSYYEPWGYTPIESAAMGVPAVTTDLAGCGMYLDEKLKDQKDPGIWIVKRKGRSYSQVVDSLYTVFHDYVHLDHSERGERKIAAKKAVELTDWKQLIDNYIEAHNIAIDKVQ